MFSRIAVLMIALAAAAFAQLVSKPASSSSSVRLDTQNPSPYKKGSDNSALNGATENMKSVSEGDSLTGTLIGIGAEIIGTGMKETLSPETPEAHARDLERMRQ